MVVLMNTHLILKKKTRVVREHKLQVLLAALPLFILTGLAYTNSFVALIAGLLVGFADLYFMYKIVNLIKPSETYKKHLGFNKARLFVNYYLLQIVILAFIGLMSFVTAVTLISPRDFGRPINPSPIQFGIIVITFVIILVALLFISQTPYLIAYAAFGRIDEKYISVRTSMRKSISLMKKHGLHYVLFTIRISVWLLVPFGLIMIGALLSLALGILFYILVLILIAPFCFIVALNIYVSKLFYFDELAREENLLTDNQI